jgi:hypothetical protein
METEQPEHSMLKTAMPQLADYMKVQFDMIQANAYNYKEEVYSL